VDENKNVTSFLKGFVLGGIAGAVLAFLFAPKSGKELREDIKKKTSEFADEASKTYGDAKVLANKIIADGKKKAEELHRQAEEKIREAQKIAAELIAEGKEKFESIRTSAKEKLDMFGDEMADEDSEFKGEKTVEHKEEMESPKGKKGKAA